MKKKYALGLLALLFYAIGLSILPVSADELPRIYTVDWSADGSRFAIVTRLALTIYDASFVQITSQEFPDDLAFVPPDLAFSRDGEKLYIGRRSLDPKVVSTRDLQQYCASYWSAAACAEHAILDTDSLEMLLDLSHLVTLSSYTATWSRDGSSIAFRVNYDRATSIFSTADGSLLRSFSPPPLIWTIGSEAGHAWSPDNAYFAKGGGDSLYILDAVTGEITLQHQFVNEGVWGAAWSPDSTRVAAFTGIGATTYQPMMHILDLRKDEVILTVTEPPINFSWNATWSPDGSQIAAISGRSRLYILDSNSGEVIDSFQIPPYQVLKLTYSPYGGRLIIATRIGGFKTDPAPDFVPLSTYMQPALDGVILFVAPAASPERLSALLKRCVSQTELVLHGEALISTRQYAEFTDWIGQQPASIIPESCAADLEMIALTILNR
jgi:WD40 repeat protein